MGLTDLKKELQSLDKPQLVGLILDLYKRNKAVQEALDFYIFPDENALFERYKTKVVEAFYPKRGFGLKLREGKKAISDFKKFAPAPELLLSLMLHYVETGVEFTAEFGDIDEGFYTSLENTFEATLKLAQKESLLPLFADRSEAVVRKTKDFGWGFHDCLYDSYSEYYEEKHF